MAKIPILQREAVIAPDCCDNCRFADPSKMEGATRVTCMRFPRTEVKRTSDWCGEYEALVIPEPTKGGA